MFRFKLCHAILCILAFNLHLSFAKSVEICEGHFNSNSSLQAVKGAVENALLPSSMSTQEGLSFNLHPSNEDFLSIYFGRNPEVFDIVQKIVGGTRRTSFFTGKYYLKLLTQALSNSISNPEEYILSRIKNDFRLNAQSFSPSRQQLLNLDLSRSDYNRIRTNFSKLLSLGKDAETLFKALYYFTHEYSMKFVDKTSKTRAISEKSSAKEKLEVGDIAYYIVQDNGRKYREKVSVSGINPSGLLTLSNGWYQVNARSLYVNSGCYGNVCVGDEVYFRGSKYVIDGILLGNNSLFTISSGTYEWWSVQYGSLSLIENKPDSHSVEEVTEWTYSFTRGFWKSIRVSFDLKRHFNSIKPQSINTIEVSQEEEVIQLQDLSESNEALSAEIDSNTSPSEIALLTSKFMERLTSFRGDIVTAGINVLKADTQYVHYLLDLQLNIEGGKRMDRNQFNQIFGVRNRLVAKSIEQIDSLKTQINELENLSRQLLERLELLKSLDSNSSSRSQNFFALQVETIQRISNEVDSLREAVRRLETQSSNELFLIRSLMSSLDNGGLETNGMDFLKELIKVTQ